MQKYTYPIVFIFNEETAQYNGYIPDLGVASIGDKLEDAYSEAEEAMKQFVQIALANDIEFEPASGLEEITAKWVGFKTSLITVDLSPRKKRK